MDIREALEAKYDEIEAEPDGAAPVADTAETTSAPPPPDVEAEPAPSTETAEQKAERARDEAGRFAKQPKAPAKVEAVKPAPIAAGVKGGVGQPVAGAPDKPPASTVKAPQFLRPGVREKFGALPPDVQQDIYRLNTELVRASREAEAARKAAEGASPWNDAIRPYEAQIRATGQEPAKYVGSLLQTAHALSYGSPDDKARVAADIIASFNIPPQLLDQALVARFQGQPAPQVQPQQFRDPRLDQLLTQMQERQREVATAQEQEASSTMQDFAAAHEFYEDLREDMANILDVWAKQGKKDVTDTDLEKAYTLASQLNPDVAPLIEQRKAAEAAAKTAASTARARSAASSPRSSPTGMTQAQPKGLREVLEAKADELGIS